MWMPCWRPLTSVRWVIWSLLLLANFSILKYTVHLKKKLSLKPNLFAMSIWHTHFYNRLIQCFFFFTHSIRILGWLFTNILFITLLKYIKFTVLIHVMHLLGRISVVSIFPPVIFCVVHCTRIYLEFYSNICSCALKFHCVTETPYNDMHRYCLSIVFTTHYF